MRWLFVWIALIAFLDNWLWMGWLALFLAVLCFAWHESTLEQSKREYDEHLKQLKAVRHSLPESLDWLRRQEKR